MRNIPTVKRKARMLEIWHNNNQGLISIKKDNNWIITMADKNLGATDIWQPGDVLSDHVCGNYYQWGNNHPFKYENQTKKSNTKVDVSGYGPGNYYNDDTFRTCPTSPSTYQNPENSNMWGDDDDTFEARRGPCPEGYHIPSKFEAAQLYIGQEILKRCLIPNSGFILGKDGTAVARGNLQWNLWTSSQHPATYTPYEMYGCIMLSRGFNEKSGYRSSTTTGCTIRPFKNEVVIPDGSSDWVMLKKLIIKGDPII